MKNYIIGTAGHVDHGKTMLIKALTGIDTDRLKEEKKRGITIELGFAHITLPHGEEAGIIDVPGHEKFVKNMLAGAGGIDLVLLVVAADEGFMPQTREHLGILSLLGIQNGIIVLTKTDMVDEEWLEVVKEDIRSEVQGSFLADAPIVPVSAYTGDGIEGLRLLIEEKLQAVQQKNTSKPFRIPVDRVFSVDGFGTVITGTLIEGTVTEGDEVMIYPGEKLTKVRNLQVHNQTVSTAYAGQRVAVNLANIKKSEVERGDTLAVPGSMQNSLMLDVKLSILKECQREIESGSRLHLYLGSRDVLCKLVLLDDREQLTAQESGYAQLRLTDPIAVKRGDHFVVRFYSPIETVGGGVVLDPAPERHKRSDPAVLESLAIKEKGSLEDTIRQAVLEGSPKFRPLDAVRESLDIPQEEFAAQVKLLEEAGELIPITGKLDLHRDYLATLQGQLTRILEEYHKSNPLQAGMRKDELRSRFLPGREIALCDKILDWMEGQGHIRYAGQKVALSTFTVSYSESHKRLSDKIEKIYLDSGLASPAIDEVAKQFAKEKETFKQVMEALQDDGTVIALSPQIAIHRNYYDQAFAAFQKLLEANGQVSLGEFRDAIETSRKYAVALLEYWDRKGITKKVGDARVLIQK